ncbi:S1 family peptidase [Micromonospora sp. PSH03]|uniref:trypsin-like serine protease n=1 Tax=Micromonospora TaxID=1873 RepID=UPI001B378318|nr:MULTISPECIES: trypsin-like serine protease [Micromonospora]MBQ0994762.1 trypsin-like serine protease [Micromonospora sp. H61]MCG5458286.1 S1 family peptidase [Micromonospora salmantinae]
MALKPITTSFHHLEVRLLRRLIASSIAVVALLLASTASPAVAAGYMFKPGHPMFFGFPNNPDDYCTGGYAVRGTSGMFITTAGHCFGTSGLPPAAQRVVYGTDTRFGYAIRNDNIGDYRDNSFDGALVKLDAGNDAQQIVVDPLTGRSPGNGRVMGYYNNSALTPGFVIGKMGRTTGWTEGSVTNWQHVGYDENGDGIADTLDYLLCSTVPAARGDSGGPVWRMDANGVMAIGIVVAVLNENGRMCFNPIQNVLNRFGAWLPVFAAKGASASASTAQPLVVTERSGPAVPINLTPVSATRL